MKNKIKIQLGLLFLFLVLVLVLMFSFVGQDRSGKLTQQLDAVCKRNNFNGSVAVFKDTVQIYRKNNGFADFENETKIDNNTVFAIGSVSKQFTAVLVLLQMEKGRLSVEDKVSKYLKEFQTKEYENITIHQLLSHTSGLNILGGKLMFKSGTNFFYSNDGYNSLGKVIEKVSRKSFDENLLELFKKAGMVNSSTGTLFSGKNFASAYVDHSGQYEKVKNMPERLGWSKIGVPAGGIISSVQDLNRWNNALYGGRILQSKTLEKLISKSAERNHPVFERAGYGYGIMLGMEGPKSYFHYGYVQGSPSLLIYYPDTKTSVIILSNTANESNGQSLIFKPHIEAKRIFDPVLLSAQFIKITRAVKQKITFHTLSSIIPS